LFTSKGNPGDKETNPLVLKEALSWNIPILAHKLDSYLNKLDDQVTWLSDDFNINLLKISRFLGISDRKIKCWIEDTKIDFDFLDSYESLVNKLICVYESDNDLLVYRTKVQAGAMWVQPHCVKRFINGLRVRIYDVPGDYFSNLSDEDLLTEHNILFEKNFYLKKQPDVKIQGQKRKFYGIKDDASSWYTFYETLHKEYYKDLQLKEGDSVIDIGGHYGFFDLYALNQKVSHIHTIEPTKTSFDILSKNLSGFKNIKKHNLAISSDNENRTFNLVGPSATCTFHENYNTSKENSTSQGIIKKETVKCLSFDQFMKNNCIDRVDAIKMDCEGSEWDILPTISDDFFRYKLRKFSMEAHSFGVDNMKETALAFIERLEKLGYNVITESRILNSGETGNIWATRYPKIKIVHMLVDTSGEREIKSIQHLKKLSEYSGWDYIQKINPLRKDLPPKETCARPNDVQLEPGDYK
jgi:FkbM family methyltransferase